MHFKVLATFVLLISLLLSAYFIKSTLDIYKTRSRIDDAKNELERLKKQNIDLKGDVEYRKTDDFVINEAREKLNYSFEGEKIVVVPKTEFEGDKEIEGEKKENTKHSGESKKQVSLDSIPVQWVKVFL